VVNLADEAHREVHALGRNPSEACGRGSVFNTLPQLGAEFTYAPFQVAVELDGNEEPHTTSMRRTMSSAACDAWNLTCSRPPMNLNVRDRRAAAVTAAMATVPTGFSAVPPPGPAMPVTPTPTSTPARDRMPSAIACATNSLTAPCSAIFSAGTLS